MSCGSLIVVGAVLDVVILLVDQSCMASRDVFCQRQHLRFFSSRSVIRCNMGLVGGRLIVVDVGCSVR